MNKLHKNAAAQFTTVRRRFCKKIIFQLTKQQLYDTVLITKMLGGADTREELDGTVTVECNLREHAFCLFTLEP